ncbi:MAG: family 43 glycosylhydrolase [Pseudobutyrivibrio sp.]|nr:family 43 glycosylhydrolase [Pseudobutyrivibrio sp.]
MKKFKKAVAIALSAAMATSGAQISGFGSIEAQAATSISRVSVHDPSIYEDNGTYYVFGSHVATASSTDLVNWKQISTDYQDPENNPIYGNLKENLAESFEWAGYDDGDCAGGNYAVWAPDVIYNENYEWEDGTKGAYMLYYSASSTWRRSCIGFMVSKTVDGGYEYGDTIMYSGFTNTGKVNYDGNSTRDTTWTNDYLPFNDLIAEGKIDGDASTWKCFNKDGSWNNNYAPNAIDPTLFYDASGEHMYMVYGSWSGGLFILEIDQKTGEAIYPGHDGKEETSGNTVDRYFGTHIAGGNHQSGEGPYIQYDENTGYYYLYETYGGLTTTGGYNMRMFRSKNVFGPYVDPAGNEAQNSGVDCYKYGVKLIGNYQFYDQPGYRAAGHNSAMITDDGDYYLIFHQRFLDPSVGEYHEVRVRQQFLNEDEWPVTAVYENRNEKISKYTEDEVVGTYEFVNHGNAEKSGDMIVTEDIELLADGTITGDETGTWEMKDGEDYTYVTLHIGDATYKGVFFEQKNDNEVETMTFTAFGDNNLAIWGSKYEQSDARTVDNVIDKLSSVIPSTTREDIVLPESMSGAEISWESDNSAVLSNTGKVTVPAEDTVVTLTATVSSGAVTKTTDIKVTVYDAPHVLAGYDFENVDGTNVKATSTSKTQDDATLIGTASVVEDETRGDVLKVENAAGNKQVNYLSLPGDIFETVDKSGYSVSMWVNIGDSTFEHSALFEADRNSGGSTIGNYPMTRIGANLIGRINANGYADANPTVAYSDVKGTWKQVTYTVSTTGLNVYLDGQLIGQEKKDLTTPLSGTDTSIQKVNNVMVGAGAIWGDEDCEDVLFDDVRIYDTALTDSEVVDLYDSTKTEEKDEEDEEEEVVEPEEKTRAIDEEEELGENETRMYIHLEDEEFADGAYIYAAPYGDDGAEFFGPEPGKKMAHIGNCWYSVNVSNDMLYSEEEEEDVEEAEPEEELVEEPAEEDVDNEEVAEPEVVEPEAEEAVENDDAVESEEAEEPTEDNASEEENDIFASLLSMVKSAFSPMQVSAAEHQLFADEIVLSVSNGDGYTKENITAAFQAERPTAEQLNQDEEEETKPSDSTTESGSTSDSSSSSNTGSSSSSNSSSSSSSSNSSSSSSSSSAAASQITSRNDIVQSASNDVQAPLAGTVEEAKKSSSSNTTKKSSAKIADTEDEEDAAVEEAEEETAEEETDETIKENTVEEANAQMDDASAPVTDENNQSTLFAIIIVIIALAVVGVLGFRFYSVRRKR